MTEEDERNQAQDELELEPEMVKDLDVDGQDAANIQGGQSVGGTVPGPTHVHETRST